MVVELCYVWLWGCFWFEWVLFLVVGGCSVVSFSVFLSFVVLVDVKGFGCVCGL